VGPTQPPVQWVAGLSRGCRGLKTSSVIPLLSLRACVACKRVNPTFITHIYAIFTSQLLGTGLVGRDSSVGITTRYSLDGPGIESRWETRFSALVHTKLPIPGYRVFLEDKAVGAWL
jgi:hypothetical protein